MRFSAILAIVAASVWLATGMLRAATDTETCTVIASNRIHDFVRV
jgi:hypothetical protein